MSSRVYLFFPPRGHEPPPTLLTVSTHTSAFNAVAFQSPTMPNARMSLWTQSVHSFSFPPRPLRTAPSRFPKMIRFGSRPPLIQRSVPAHKSLLVRNVVSMLSHPVISCSRLNPAGNVCLYFSIESEWMKGVFWTISELSVSTPTNSNNIRLKPRTRGMRHKTAEQGAQRLFHEEIDRCRETASSRAGGVDHDMQVVAVGMPERVTGSRRRGLRLRYFQHAHFISIIV